jgi:hypothetical protein
MAKLNGTAGANGNTPIDPGTAQMLNGIINGAVAGLGSLRKKHRKDVEAQTTAIVTDMLAIAHNVDQTIPVGNTPRVNVLQEYLRTSGFEPIPGSTLNAVQAPEQTAPADNNQPTPAQTVQETNGAASTNNATHASSTRKASLLEKLNRVAAAVAAVVAYVAYLIYDTYAIPKAHSNHNLAILAKPGVELVVVGVVAFLVYHYVDKSKNAAGHAAPAQAAPQPVNNYYVVGTNGQPVPQAQPGPQVHVPSQQPSPAAATSGVNQIRPVPRPGAPVSPTH